MCRTYILAEDLEHFLEAEKAQQAFDILDVDGDGQVTLHNIRDAVVSIYQVCPQPPLQSACIMKPPSLLNIQIHLPHSACNLQGVE